MTRYLIKRILFMIPLLLGITIICFAVMHLAPGKPTDLQTQMNPKASAEMKERLLSLYELDKPLHVQYVSWLKKLARGDLGTSFSSDHRPVADKILERLPITILINVLSLLIIIAVAVPIGVLSAVYQDSLFDKVTAVVVFVGFAVPTFWLALLLMIFFGIHLGWLPISGLRSLNYEYLSTWAQLADLAGHLVLPVFISAFGGLRGFPATCGPTCWR
jgi:peptide/nickel transport system permease protein